VVKEDTTPVDILVNIEVTVIPFRFIEAEHCLYGTCGFFASRLSFLDSRQNFFRSFIRNAEIKLTDLWA
jgi:hypothetical protein